MAHFEQLHEWSLTPREAIALQKSLRVRVRIEPLTRGIETVAGADISFDKFSPVLYAGIVVLRLPSLEVVEEVCVVSETKFPYVPGLLSFRETPPVLEAWAMLKTEPDAVMFDGQGIAHPLSYRGCLCRARHPERRFHFNSISTSSSSPSRAYSNSTVA